MPSQVFGTVILEAGFLALIGVGFGAMIGLGLEWYVLRVLLLTETGFAFPVSVPWADVGLVAMGAGLGSLLAGLGPAISASRMPLSRALGRG